MSKLNPSQIAILALVGGLILLQLYHSSKWEDRQRAIEDLCYDAHFLVFPLEDALEDNLADAKQGIEGLVIDDDNQRRFPEVVQSISQRCYSLGAEYL